MAEDETQLETKKSPLSMGEKLVYALVALGALGIIFTIVLAVMAVLAVILFVFIGYFYAPTQWAPALTSSCTFPPGITCVTYAVHNSTSLDLQIGQATGHPIVVNEIACIPYVAEEGLGPIPAPSSSDYYGSGMAVRSGEVRWVAGPLANAPVRCGNGGQVGNTFRGRIWIKYTETDTNMSRTVVGDIKTKYVP